MAAVPARAVTTPGDRCDCAPGTVSLAADYGQDVSRSGLALRFAAGGLGWKIGFPVEVRTGLSS